MSRYKENRRCFLLLEARNVPEVPCEESCRSEVMIETENTFGTTTIYCDGCEYEQEFEGFDGFVHVEKAIGEAKDYGWEIIKAHGEWEHYCFECANTK